MGLGEGFDDDKTSAVLIALMKFGVEGAGEGFGVMGNDTDAAEGLGGWDVGVRDDVAGGKGLEFGMGVELVKEV